MYVAERRVRGSLVDNPGPPPLRVLREPQGPLPTVPGSRRGLLLQVRVRRGLPEHLRLRPAQAALLRGLLPVPQRRQVPRGHRHERLHLLAQHPLSVRLGARHAAAALRRAALEALAGQDLRPPRAHSMRTFQFCLFTSNFSHPPFERHIFQVDSHLAPQIRELGSD